MIRKILYFLYVIVVVFVLMEILLRIWNPFPSGIKGDKIVLGVNTRMEFDNNIIPVIDKKIVHSKNALGFRGPDLPERPEEYFRIIAVGGSTTECTFLSDGQTWCDKLYERLRQNNNHIWLNNAGLSGHSTFGHKILLEDYIVRLKPDMVIFLIGCNEIGRDELIENYSMKGHYSSVASFFVKNSELCNVINNLVRARRAKGNNLTDHYTDPRKLKAFPIGQDSIRAELDMHRQYLEAYKDRLKSLLDICSKNNIEPVLITQPALFGDVTDPVSGVYLGDKMVGFKFYNGLLWWQVLELYNDVTRDMARRQNILLIDLAKQLPKSSAYFYDMVHLTPEGTSVAGELIYDALRPYLAKKPTTKQ